MSHEMKYSTNKMKISNTWEKEEISVASIGELEGGYISVGCDEGPMYILNSLLELKSELHLDHKFPTIDHFWKGHSQVCITQGKNIGLFDAEKQKQITSFVGHTDKNKHENYFASAGDDNSVLFWDLRMYKPINFILAHSSAITSLDIFEDSSVILTTSDEGYSYGKFSKTSDYALLASLNSKVSLVDTRTSKVMREYGGHMNNEYIVELDFSKNSKGDIDGFFVGSENGMIHRYSLLNQSPVDSLMVNEQSQTADLLIVKDQCLYASGRSWFSVHKIAFSPDG